MSVKKILDNRMSARSFNIAKKIKEKNIITILKAGYLAPNAMGLEAWNFHVIKTDKEKLYIACDKQPLIKQSGFCVVITAPTIQSLKKERETYIKRLVSKGVESAKSTFYIDAIINSENAQYLREQTFLAANSMIIQAEDLSIKSIIIGGYNTNEIADVIGVDLDSNQICSVIAFGYTSDLNALNRNTRKFDDVVVYLD